MRTGLGREEALELVRAIEGGSIPAWHRFVDEYAGLILAVAGRYLAFSGVDARRDVFAVTLEKLRAGALYRYDGRSRLSTWLFIFSRSRCLDFLRAERGRKLLPTWLRGLSKLDRRVFRLYYLEGLGRSALREILAHQGHVISSAELAASLERLDRQVDDGMRRRIAYDLFAQSVGLMSGRLLEFLQNLKIECESRSDLSEPEFDMLQQEVAQAAEQVRQFILRLPELERKVIALRFYDGRTAREASRVLNLDGQREVYTVESRAIRRLRSMFSE